MSSAPFPSSRPTLRLLPTAAADGPANMSTDEALLEVAGPTTLRLYSWDPPTVSLGYFQDHASVTAGLPPGTAVVRRITGGGAIWHEHEVTYGLVGVPGRDGLPERTADCYRVLHAAVLAAIQARGGRLRLQAQTVGDRRYRDEPRCFASPAADDLVASDAIGKVLGSAARRRGDRLLIHGSLKLASNAWDGDAVAGCGLDRAQAEAALLEAIPAALGATPVPGVLTAEELAARDRLRRARYGDDGWVVRRTGPRP